MEFTGDNKVLQLCAMGMEKENSPEEALKLFEEAWKTASTDYEKSMAAHYMARHQNEVSEKLTWDKVALKHALNIEDEKIKSTLPSLYLNIGKCYEDLNDFDNAIHNYHAASSFAEYLP